MNPLLTANFRAERELQQEIEKQNLSEIGESLRSALPWLENAYCLMNSNRLDTKYSDLYTAICDAMTATQEACSSLEDEPDDSPTVPGSLDALLEAVAPDNSEI
jgi:DNA repair ATPase RecN